MQRWPKLAALVAVLTLLLGVVAASPADARPQTAAAPTAVGTRYIVQVDPAAGPLVDVLQAAVAPLGGTVDAVFTEAIHGAVVTLPVPGLELLRVPGILTVERDATVRTVAEQPGATWGLDRTDQRNLPLDSTFGYTSTGSGVEAYVIDTGIRLDHTDFAGRISSRGFSAFSGGPNDCNGHGTHVAGTIGGSTYGVAKQVTLIPVRVLDCNGSGSTSGVIAGVEWAIDDHTTAPAVANLSLGGGASAALDTAIRNLSADGVAVAVAAGNETTNACSGSPARVAEAITVAASDRNDAMASFSNGGTCVDLFAPGVSITSAWHTGPTATSTISGTSMAAPHVAGAAARHLQANPGATPAQVEAALNSSATLGKVSGTARSCRLLFLLCRPATANNRLLHVSPTA
ncbi:MAG: S8 family peptidase [Acidimicrobiales bacterium]